MIYKNDNVRVDGKSNGDFITAYQLTLSPAAMRALVNMVRMEMGNDWLNGFATGDQAEDQAEDEQTKKGGIDLLDAVDNSW